MEKQNRWIAQHATLVYAIGIAVSIVACLMLQVWLPGWLCYILMLAGIFFSSQWAYSRSNVLMRQPLETLRNACDPGPFLEETTRQLRYPGPANLRLMRRGNYALALTHTGKLQESLELLVSIPVETTRGIPVAWKVIHYNNLLTVCMRLDMHKEAEVAYQKMMEHFAVLKNKKDRQTLSRIVEMKQVAMKLHRREYAQALSAFTSTAQNRLEEVAEARILALIYLGLGEQKKAQEKLEFVVQNGNRLSLVAEAQALLANINMEEQT